MVGASQLLKPTSIHALPYTLDTCEVCVLDGVEVI